MLTGTSGKNFGSRINGTRFIGFMTRVTVSVFWHAWQFFALIWEFTALETCNQNRWVHMNRRNQDWMNKDLEGFSGRWFNIRVSLRIITGSLCISSKVLVRIWLSTHKDLSLRHAFAKCDLHHVCFVLTGYDSLRFDRNHLNHFNKT